MIENIDDILYKTREVLNTRPHFSINNFYVCRAKKTTGLVPVDELALFVL